MSQYPPSERTAWGKGVSAIIDKETGSLCSKKKHLFSNEKQKHQPENMIQDKVLNGIWKQYLPLEIKLS